MAHFLKKKKWSICQVVSANEEICKILLITLTIGQGISLSGHEGKMLVEGKIGTSGQVLQRKGPTMTMLHNYLTFSTNLEMMNYYLLPRVSLLFVEHISFSFLSTQAF